MDRNGKTASATSYRTVTQGVSGVPGVPDFPLQPILVVRYDDTFQKIDDEWWFKTTKLTFHLPGNTSYHVRGSVG